MFSPSRHGKRGAHGKTNTHRPVLRSSRAGKMRAHLPTPTCVPDQACLRTGLLQSGLDLIRARTCRDHASSGKDFHYFQRPAGTSRLAYDARLWPEPVVGRWVSVTSYLEEPSAAKIWAILEKTPQIG